MTKVGDHVQVPSKRVGQLPREGVVTGVSGTMLRMKWSTGEESTLVPGAGSVVVIPKVRGASSATTKATKAAQTSNKSKVPTRQARR